MPRSRGDSRVSRSGIPVDSSVPLADRDSGLIMGDLATKLGYRNHSGRLSSFDSIVLVDFPLEVRLLQQS